MLQNDVAKTERLFQFAYLLISLSLWLVSPLFVWFLFVTDLINSLVRIGNTTSPPLSANNSVIMTSLTSVYFVTIFASIFCNSMIILIIRTRHFLKFVTSYLILNQAYADLIITFTIMLSMLGDDLFPSCPQATYQASVFWCSISPCPFWPWRFCIQSCAHVFLSREAPWDEAGQNARHAEAVKTAKKITLMIIVAVLFTLCWCPFFVFVGLNSVHKIVLQYAAFKFIVWLANAYSAINPFIYLLFDEKFRN